ncbi:MAG: HAMP domain-containing protein [Candidatus Riflebacteria bacterium]|nr:HAMP domain-containing protein [Candidatus Riflebacteria bacterium]
MLNNSKVDTFKMGFMELAQGKYVRMFFLWLFFFSVTFVIPAWLFKSLLIELNASLKNARIQIQEEKAGEILNSLDQNLDVLRITERKLRIFRERVGFLLNKYPLEEKNLDRFRKLFFSVFPKSSTLIWFDKNGNPIPEADGTIPVLGKRAWKSFFGVLSQKKIERESELKIAEKASQTLFGDIITIEMLRSGPPLHLKKVIFRNHLSLFSFFHFSKKKSAEMQGSLIVLLPLDRSKKDWEMARAVERFEKLDDKKSDKLIQIACMRISNGEIYSTINPGFMPVLLERLNNGESRFEIGKRLYLAQLKTSDPDVMLAVGVAKPDIFLSFAESISGLLLDLIYPLGIIWAIITALKGLGVITLVRSLQTKFILGILLLTGMPLSAMLINQLNFLTNVYQVQKKGINSSLENMLMIFEQMLSEEFQKKEKQMQEIIIEISNAKGKERRTLLNFLRKEYSSGLMYALFVRKYGVPLIEDLTSIVGIKHFSPNFSARSHEIRTFFSSLVYELLNKIDFPVSEIKYKKLGKSDGLSEMLSNTTRAVAYKFIGKFQTFSFGSSSGIFCAKFLDNFQIEKNSFLFTAYTITQLRKEFVKKVLRRIESETGVKSENFFFGINGYMSSNVPGMQVQIRKIIDLVNSTGEQMFRRITVNDRDYILLAKPLKSIETNFGVFLPLEHFKNPVTDGVKSTFGFFILAFTGALFSAVYLSSSHLVPLLKFTGAVEKVDKGDYSKHAEINSEDEIGELGRSFNEMLTGLQEKQRMSSFLNSELLEDTEKSDSVAPVEKQRLSVLFCGLRGFSAIERNLSPENAMSIMSRFLGVCTESVKSNGGEIDKFIGDTAMAIFRENAASGAKPTDRAMAAAFAIKMEMDKWSRNRKLAKLFPLKFGVGISYGEVLAGKIGSFLRRLDFTVIGDTVNVAARLEKIAGSKGFPVILATQDVVTNSSGNFFSEQVEISSVRGRSGEIKIFSLREKE